MPREAIAIREVERAVSRPIAFDVLRELLPRWGLDKDKVKLIMFGTTDTIPLTHSSLHKEAKPHRLFNDLSVVIEVDENYAEYGPAYQPYKEKEYPAIFIDRDLRIGVRPVYREVQAEVRVTIDAKSRVQAEQIARKMQAEMRSYSQYDHHEVEYHYQIQPEIVKILNMLWDQRETYHPLGDTFSDWFMKNVDKRITTNYNHGNKGHQFAIRESQVSITGWCDFSDPPKADKQETGMLHQYSFSYKYTYMRPEHILIYYPVAIHNRMVTDMLLDKTKLLDASDYYGGAGWSHRALMGLNYMQGYEYLWQRVAPINIPHYDDWQDYKFSESFEKMFQALLITNTDVPGHLIKMDDMGSWKFKESAMAYMARRLDGNVRPFDSIFQFSLHEWETRLSFEQMHFDVNLNLTYTGTLDPRKNYHMVICLVTDPSRLSIGAVRDLLLDGSLVRDYIDIIHPGAGDQIADYPNTTHPIRPITLNPDGSMNWDDWQQLLEVIFKKLKKNRSRDRVYTNIITYHVGD